jgi:MarR family 2-MHQ and catechol resistance regulon transcriptional repressor
LRLLIDAWKRVQRGAEKNLLRVDLTVAEFRTLRVLKEEGSSPMNRFCSATLLSQPTITGIVDKLEERGLVERVRSLKDRREVLIALTPKGSSVFARAEEVHREFMAELFSVLGHDETLHLQRLLSKLADSLQEAQAPVVSH